MKRYALYILAAAVFAALVSAYGLNAAGPPDTGIALRNFPIDAAGSTGDIPPGLSKRPSVPGSPVFVIVKFTDRYNQDDRDRLSGRGIRFYGYIPDNAFTAKVPPGRRTELEADPSVSAVYDFLPAYAMHERVLEKALSGETGAVDVRVMVFDGEPLGPILGRIRGLGGSPTVVSDTDGLNGKLVEANIDVAGLAGLAMIDGVGWIEPMPVRTKFNDVAAPVMNADQVWTAAVPLDGTGQIIAVCDTGLDTGKSSTMHQDFSGNTSDGYAKVKATFAYGRTNVWSDPDGHGTHVAGSALGSGSASSGLFKGIANDARLVFQSTLNNVGDLSIPDLNTTVFPDAYGQGARVHNNSWGNLWATGGDYDYDSVMSDTYIWNNPDFVAVFAAGNEGVDNSPANGVVDYGSISAPSTAKNVISVGGTENNRPSFSDQYGYQWPSDFPNEPIHSDGICDDPYGMIGFSSRGPCDDGRIKPDILAPGTHIISTKSSVNGAYYWLSPSSYGYSSSYNTYYASLGGTSMSTPLTSGAAALVREFLVNEGLVTPSAALVKAMLIAGARDLTPGQYPAPYEDVTARPDNNQGWGLVDLERSLYPASPIRQFFADYTSGLTTGVTESYSYSVVDTSVPVRVNLVWSDYPGTAYSATNLVNDLNLTVTAPDGTVYHGNVYTGSDSTPDPSAYDDTNNVEGVTIPASSLSTGGLGVSVSGYNVPSGPQPFALVVNGGLGELPAIGSVYPASGMNNSDTAVLVRGSKFQSGAAVTVGGEGVSVSFVTYTTIGATVPYGLAAGAKDVAVTNTDGGSDTLAGGFTVVADTNAPGMPGSLFASPGDGSVNLTWTQAADSDILEYRVYYSTYSTSAGIADTHLVGGLTNDVEHTFHVRAVDKAGNLGGASNDAPARPLAPDPELPHYAYDGSGQFACGACHTEPSGGFLPQGFDYRTDPAVCTSCHNQASVAHDRTVDRGTHALFSDVTASGASMPTFGSVTSGEYSDTMFTHLDSGRRIVCVTCHNAMRKPGDPGRAWEVSSGSGKSYAPGRGGWWDRGSREVRVHHDNQLWTPSLSRDRKELLVDPSGYVLNRYSGILTFDNPTGGYVYFTMDDPYLRAPVSDGTACSDCHTQQAMHMGLDCMFCHGAHETGNIRFVRQSLRAPDGTQAVIVFTNTTGPNSFADGDGTYDGVCEVCHTGTLYYRSDGTGLANHTSTGLNYSGTDCTDCHTHTSGFSK